MQTIQKTQNNKIHNDDYFYPVTSAWRTILIHSIMPDFWKETAPFEGLKTWNKFGLKPLLPCLVLFLSVYEGDPFHFVWYVIYILQRNIKKRFSRKFCTWYQTGKLWLKKVDYHSNPNVPLSGSAWPVLQCKNIWLKL